MNGNRPFPISLVPLFQNESKCENHCYIVTITLLLYESKFDLHENEPVSGTHFHRNNFA